MFFIVADKKRKNEFEDKINQSIYNPIKPLVAFVDYENLANQHSRMAELFKNPMVLWKIMRDTIKIFVLQTKEAYKKGDLPNAVRYWNYIYDELGDITLDNFSEWRESMSQFSDEEVFKITDYYKKAIGYY